MKISIVYTGRGPFKVYLDKERAIKEYKRLCDLDDLVDDYAVVEMQVEGA
jgi:hypothetical protein